MWFRTDHHDEYQFFSNKNPTTFHFFFIYFAYRSPYTMFSVAPYPSFAIARNHLIYQFSLSLYYIHWCHNDLIKL